MCLQTCQWVASQRYWTADASPNGYHLSTLSPKFNVSNGVRQGGILSPLFFNLYMDRLSVTLSETKVGCALGKTMVNHLAYADDLVILSPSVKGLQKLLNICSEYGEEHDIMFNHKKKRNVCIFQSKVVLLLIYPRFS